MELKIVDPNSNTLNGQFGVTDARMDELLMHLNDMVIDHINEDALIPKSKVFTEIASACNTVEELMMCVHAYDGFMFENFEQCTEDGSEID